MNGFRLISLLVVVLSLPLVAAQQAARPSAARQANIGVVRADGVVLPVAAVRNGVWRSLSTDSRSGGSAMTAEARAWPRTGWTLAPVAGGAARSFTLTKPTTADYECSSSEVFDSSLSSPRRLQGQETIRHLGLAMNGTGTIEPVVDLVENPDAASRDVSNFITRMVQALEAERVPAVATWRPELRKFIESQQPARPVTVVRLFRHVLGPVPWHYFEAEKAYREMGTVFFVSGWLGAFGMESRLTDVRAGFGGDSDNRPLPPTEVLGVVRTGPDEGATWFLAWHTDVDLIYSLIQIGAGNDVFSLRHVLDVTANHCLP